MDPRRSDEETINEGGSGTHKNTEKTRDDAKTTARALRDGRRMRSPRGSTAFTQLLIQQMVWPHPSDEETINEGGGSTSRHTEKNRDDVETTALTMREGHRMRSERGGEPFAQLLTHTVAGPRRQRVHQGDHPAEVDSYSQMASQMCCERGNPLGMWTFGRRKLVTMPTFLR